jgi:hypothetical protein
LTETRKNTESSTPKNQILLINHHISKLHEMIIIHKLNRRKERKIGRRKKKNFARDGMQENGVTVLGRKSNQIGLFWVW